jgi:hypothetical protein
MKQYKYLRDFLNETFSHWERDETRHYYAVDYRGIACYGWYDSYLREFKIIPMLMTNNIGNGCGMSIIFAVELNSDLTMTDEQKLLVGAIVLTEGESFISDAIVEHLRIYAHQEHMSYTLPYSHGEILISWNGELYTMGAREHGAEMTLASEYYKGKEGKYVVLPCVVPLTDKEIAKLEAYANDVCYVHKRKYQYQNLFAFIEWIKWYRKKNIFQLGDKKVYCFELVARCLYLVRRWRGSLNIVTSYHLWESKFNFKSDIKLAA